MRRYKNIFSKMSKELEYVLEFGVFKGASLRIIRRELSKRYKIFGFDSFMGLPEDWKDTYTHLKYIDEHGKKRRGKLVPMNKGHFNANGNIPKIDDVTFFKGWFIDTIPKYLSVRCENKIALIHIDSDLYSSAITILNSLNENIVKGTIIVFDEWRVQNQIIGEEEKAFNEWVESYNRKYEVICELDRGQLVVKIIL